MAFTYDLSGNDLLTNTSHGVMGTIKTVNFNATNTDNQVPITLPQNVSRYVVRAVYLNNASASISTATVGVFTAAAGGGVTIAANQAITVTATAANTVNNTQALTLTAATTTAFTAPVLFVRVGTAQGSAATADVRIIVDFLT